MQIFFCFLLKIGFFTVSGKYYKKLKILDVKTGLFINAMSNSDNELYNKLVEESYTYFL